MKYLRGRLTASGRSIDPVGRYGGEEFLIISRNVDHRFGIDCSEIYWNLCGKPVYFKGTSVDISNSIGLAWTENISDVEDIFIACADRALYEAKSEGRNRVACTVVKEEP